LFLPAKRIRTTSRASGSAADCRIDAQSAFADKFVFVEDYDINVGRYFVQGVDVWLNNPRRPLEASGTSGQKVVLNGGLNLSFSMAGGPRHTTA
jgi:glucan phosphorylase